MKIVLFEKLEGKWEVVADNLNPSTKGEPYAPGVVIPAATGEKTYVVGAYLPQDAGNEYQAKHFHGNLVVKAFQTDEGAGGPETPEAETYKVTVNYNDMAGERTFGPVQYKLGSEKKGYSVSTADLTAPENYEFVANQAAQSVVVDENGTVTPDSITFNVQKIALAEPDGSKENPYLIMNSTDFNNIPKLDGEDVYFVLGADINLGNYTPLAEFKGHLNGAHESSKYSIQYAISGTDNLALFVNNSGELKNLTIAAGSVINSSGNNAGSFAVNNLGSIVNCASYGKIDGVLNPNDNDNKNKNCGFGGIASVNEATGVINGTTYYGQINSSLTASNMRLALYTDTFMNNGGLAVSNAGRIENCGVIAPTDGSSVAGAQYTAGVVSSNTGTIRAITTQGKMLYAFREAEYHNNETVCTGNAIEA